MVRCAKPPRTLPGYSTPRPRYGVCTSLYGHSPRNAPRPPLFDLGTENVMKALCWHGTGDVRCETVPDPRIEDPKDAIVRVTSTAICGSDLHLYDGFMPTMKSGDILGHEPMGVVEEVGKEVKK